MKTIFLLLYCLAYMALAHDVTLDWNDNPEPDIAGYQVQYGTDPGLLVQMIASKVSTVKIPGLPAGTWYFAVRAVNVADLQSPLSATVNTTLVDPLPPPTAPAGLRVILQSSVDLQRWDDELEVLNKPPGRKYWRVKTIASN